MCQFRYDYRKPKYKEDKSSCYMDKKSFMFYMKTEDASTDIANNVETRFNTSKYKINRLLHAEKIKK